ncbi:hypothetical protein [Aggregatilinea lenta]|uniref:hypothetical protein n=1 Tax=Aggregatilinea lenta TaxID=913108 RepID=UPI0013C2E40C|nr:hypothetical protein [Aggregatilinea lenta]
MSNKVMHFILIIFLACSVTPVFAQGDDLPNSGAIESAGITFRYPDGWQIVDDGSELLRFTTGTVEMSPAWYTPDQLAEYGFEAGDVASVMQILQFNPVNESVVYYWTDVQTLTVGDQQMSVYEYIDTDRSGPFTTLLAAFAAPDGTVFTGDIYAVQSNTVPMNLRQEALLTLASFQMQPVAAPSGGAPDSDFDYIFEEPGIGVMLPDTWQVIYEENGFIRLESEQTYLDPYWYLDDGTLSGTGDAIPAALEDVASGAGAPYDPAKIQVIEIDGRSVTTLSYDDTFANNNVDYTGVMAGVLLEDGTIFTADIYPMWGSEITEMDAALGILASAHSATAALNVGPSSVETTYQWFSLDGLGTGFYYPISWAIEATDEGYPYLSSGLTDMNPYYVVPDEFASHGIVAGSPRSAIMMLLRARGLDRGVSSSVFDVRTVEGRDIVTYETVMQNGSGACDTLFAAVEVEDGSMIMAVVSPTAGGTLTEGELALDMLASATSEG